MEEEFEDFNNDSIYKFESMLKTNGFLFFDSDEFEEIIVYYLEIGNVSLAKKAIAMATEQYPNSIALVLLKIELLLFNNELDKAEKLIQKISLIDPLNTDLLIQQAKILSKRKNHQEAINLLIKIDSNSDLYFDALSIIGKEYLFLDDFINAKKYFILYLKHNHFDYGVLNNVLYCFDSIGDTESTINYLNSFLETSPYCEIAWHQLGKQYAKEKLYKEALTAFDFAIISDDCFIGAYIEMGKILEKINKINEAIEKYEIASKIEDPNPFALYRIACCQDKLGNHDLALLYYNKTVIEDPVHDKAWMSIALNLFEKNNLVEAKINLIKALEINSEKINYWELYAKINFSLKLYEEVEIAFNEILSLGDFNISTLTVLTRLVIKIPENNSLTKKLLKSIDLIPKSFDSEMNYLLSAIYYNELENDKAFALLKKAYFYNPSKYTFYKKIFKFFPNLQIFKTH
jgi:tetratricopeptide (TPR) repeat protein|tara:strand:+ start:6788 stop:8167 length:1380 start_codon:yes stop_codon:yes gene_type:complete